MVKKGSMPLTTRQETYILARRRFRAGFNVNLKARRGEAEPLRRLYPYCCQALRWAFEDLSDMIHNQALREVQRHNQLPKGLVTCSLQANTATPAVELHPAATSKQAQKTWPSRVLE
jgi:hypothetical protein